MCFYPHNRRDYNDHLEFNSRKISQNLYFKILTHLGLRRYTLYPFANQHLIKTKFRDRSVRNRSKPSWMVFHF